MAKNPKEAYDKGYVDGRARAKAEKNDPTGLGTALSDLFGPSSYKGDKDFPRSYREGFREGRSDEYKKK